jgi:hypothetical protein
MAAVVNLKRGAVRSVRRMAALETAAGMLGGQAALASALSCETRLLRNKLAAERPIHDADLRLAAAALEQRARAILQHADRLVEIVGEEMLS